MRVETAAQERASADKEDQTKHISRSLGEIKLRCDNNWHHRESCVRIAQHYKMSGNGIYKVVQLFNYGSYSCLSALHLKEGSRASFDSVQLSGKAHLAT